MPLAMWDIKEGIMEVEIEGVGRIFNTTVSCLEIIKTSPKIYIKYKMPSGGKCVIFQT